MGKRHQGYPSSSYRSALPILNSSDEPVQYTKGVVIVRGLTCHQMEDSQILECLSTYTSTTSGFTIKDINVNTNLNSEEQRLLLEVINQYRGCFADNISQLGKSATTNMQIKLTDDIPITYRPYRLSYSEREKVGGSRK